jgi:hypothetical protein
VAPHSRCRTELDQPIPFAIPARHRDPSPVCARPLQHLRQVRQACALGAGRPFVPGRRGGAGS